MGKLEQLEKIVNFLPRTGAALGEDIAGPFGKYAGAALGYVADLFVASFVPFDGGLTVYAVAIASPALAGYTSKQEETD